MFSKLTDMIDNALGVASDIMTGEVPSQRRVAQLLADGISVAAIAALFDVGIDVIEGLIDENDQ